MRAILFLFAVSISLPLSAHDYQAGDRVDLGFEVYDSTGRDLVRSLVNLAGSHTPLIAPDSDQEDDLSDVIDEMLEEMSQRIFVEPVADLVSRVADEIVLEFLKVTGREAFAGGVQRDQFTALVERAIMPKAASCEDVLRINIHDAAASRYDH